jgi:hypothetical protein
MPKRAIRIVKHIGATPCIAVCTHCSQQFKASDIRSLKEATASLQSQFDAHKCKALDSSQNALRIVRESTEDK